MIKLKKKISILEASYASNMERFKKPWVKIVYGDKMNGEIYSHDIINNFSIQLYDALLSLVNPITVSKTILNKWHKSYLIKKQIGYFEEKKEVLTQALIGILPEKTSYESCIETKEKFEKLIEDPKFEVEFDKINKFFDDLTPEKQEEIMIHAAEMMNNTFLEVEENISDRVIDSSDPGNMLLLGRTFRYARYLLNEVVRDINRKSKDKERMEFHMSCIMILLARILAISLKKVDYEYLYSDISFITLYIYNNDPDYFGDLEDVDRSIFTMLGDKST